LGQSPLAKICLSVFSSVNVFIGRASSGYEKLFQGFLHRKKGGEAPIWAKV
jgi:hypothetical protein